MISLEHFGAPAFVAGREPNGSFVYVEVNEAAARLTGLSRDQVAGKTVRHVFGEEAGARVEDTYADCLDRQVAVEVERIVMLQDREIATRTTVTPIFDVIGEPAKRLLGVAVDVTAQLRLQKELRRSEARLAIALDALDGAHWYYDIERREFDLGTGFGRMLGSSTPTTMGLDEWVGRVHPDDRDDTCFAAIVAGRMECGSNEFRIFTDSCDLRWLSCKRRAVLEGSRVVGVTGIVVDVTTEKRREEALSRQAATDALTGLANRRSLDAGLKQAWDDAVERRQPLSLLMIDVDHFKRYNDSYGHLAGDAALKQVAACFAAVALDHDGAAARFGGEEFAILLPGLDTEEAAGVARSILDRIRSLDHPHRGSPAGRLSVSIGVAGHPRLAPHVKADLVGLADEALYRAKEDGRDRYRVVVAPHLSLATAVA